MIRRQRERDLLRHAQTERNQLGPPIIRRRTDNDHLFSLDGNSDNSSHGSQNGNQNEPSETQPLLTRMFATPTMGLISSPLNIPRPSSAVSEAQSARSTSGWSWSDVSVTPPIFTKDPYQTTYQTERENAANQFDMKTFKSGTKSPENNQTETAL